MNDRLEELLGREYYMGVTVINCIPHMGLDLTERPDDCIRCLADLRNHFRSAILINKWLNEWKEDATKILRERG